MFKVKIGEDEYEVTFEHYPPLKVDRQTFDPIHFRERFGTICYIDGKTSVDGVADLNIKDNFNRNVGRKVSLARALQKLFPDSPLNRFVFWQAYHEARGGKW